MRTAHVSGLGFVTIVGEKECKEKRRKVEMQKLGICRLSMWEYVIFYYYV